MTPRHVVDTVALRYILIVGEEKLFLKLLGSPIVVPRVVYDPDEGEGDTDDIPEILLSELGRSIRVQQRRSLESERDKESRMAAARNAKSLRGIHRLWSKGAIDITDLDNGERAL
jgi:hypothetical protein